MPNISESGWLRLYHTPQGTLIVRPYQRGDEEQILKLFKLVFGKEKSLQHWQWEFLKHPYGIFISLAFLNGKLVAQCASIPVRIRYKNKIIKGAQFVDCMSHPKTRGIAVRKKGIFALTVQAFFDFFSGCGKIEYIYGFPGERHFKLGALVLGYKKAEPIAELISMPSSSKKSKKKFKVTHLDTLEEKDYLRITQKRNSLFSIHKPWEYFKWRYLESPIKYDLFMVKNTLCVTKNEENKVHLLDKIGPLNTGSVMESLSYYLNKPIEAWIPKNSVALETKGAKNIVVKPPKIKAISAGKSFCPERVSTEWANKNFYYVKGDSDLF